MPEISRFFGIVILVYYNDHAPPHVHVRRSREQGRVGIDPVEVLDGDLSLKTRRLVLRWAALHRAELLADWYLAQAGRPPFPIEPLAQ